MTLCFVNSVSGFSCEFQSANPDSFWDIEQSIIIGDRSNNSNNTTIKLIFSLKRFGSITCKSTDNPGYRDRISIKPGLIKPFVDDSVELGCGSTIEEGVKLSKKWATLIRVFK